MAYSDFTLARVVEQFDLTVIEGRGTFGSIAPLPSISDVLTTLLMEQVVLATMINTEKARSEFIVINVLAEVRRQMPGQMSLFSGIEIPIAKSEELSGYCNFLISTSPQQAVLRAPVVAVVEITNSNLLACWGQCLAEMIAAQRFNIAYENVIPKIYGAVTTGTNWMFGVLEGTTVTIDLREYRIDEPEKICGILIAMVNQRHSPGHQTIL